MTEPATTSRNIDVTDTAVRPASQHSDKSLGELVQSATKDLSLLVHQEFALAKAELKKEAATAGKGAGMLGGAGVTVGASAPIFGLLGAIVYYGRRGGSQMASSQAMTYAVVLFIMGLLMPGIDNYAHAGGFGGGWLAGRVLDPLKPERIDHLAAAVVCLGMSALSILASILVPIPSLPR